MHGPGILYVKACINPSPRNPLTEPTYIRWYDDDHIAEILATSGVDDAFRYFHVDKMAGCGTPTQACPRPYLAFYPMEDVGFTQGPEFKGISVRSEMLPGSGIVYDMADNDVGYYALLGRKGRGDGERCSGAYLATSEIEPCDGTTEDDVLAFLDQQAERMAKVEHYQCSLRFRLLFARTNAQSRVLKGLAEATAEPEPEPPTWLQMHAFSAEPRTDVRIVIDDEAHEVFARAKQKETHGYRLERAHGGKRFFGDAWDGAAGTEVRLE